MSSCLCISYSSCKVLTCHHVDTMAVVMNIHISYKRWRPRHNTLIQYSATLPFPYISLTKKHNYFVRSKRAVAIFPRCVCVCVRVCVCVHYIAKASVHVLTVFVISRLLLLRERERLWAWPPAFKSTDGRMIVEDSLLGPLDCSPGTMDSFVKVFLFLCVDNT